MEAGCCSPREKGIVGMEGKEYVVKGRRRYFIPL